MRPLDQFPSAHHTLTLERLIFNPNRHALAQLGLDLRIEEAPVIGTFCNQWTKIPLGLDFRFCVGQETQAHRAQQLWLDPDRDGQQLGKRYYLRLGVVHV